MPQISRIAKLPIELRREVNARLRGAGFGGYEALAAELKSRGYPVSKSALHQYGKRLRRLTRESAPDDFAYLSRVAEHSLPMTVVTVVDLQSGEARVFTTPNSIADVAMLLEPLQNAADNEVVKSQQPAV